MTAQADYGVSIVESFAPPKNWIPDQDVNKDVYATNTGNIGAFVKEEVSGVLTITQEKDKTSWSTKSVELTEEERYSKEAGAYLAYKPDGDTNKLGEQIVVRPDDQGNPVQSDFVPTADGLYVFRRTVDVINTTGSTPDVYGAETFTYDGYYYKDGKYYKISNLKTYPYLVGNAAGDGDKNDGLLSSASAGFVELEKTVVKPMDLAYDSTNNWLVATYSTGVNKNAKNLEDAAAAYDAAIHAYQTAIALKTAATTENTTATGDVTAKKAALDAAKGELDTALETLRTTSNTYASKLTTYNNLVSEKAVLSTKKNKLEQEMYGHTGGGDTGVGAGDEYYDDGSLYQKSITDPGATYLDATQVANLNTELTAWISEYNTAHPAAPLTGTTPATLTYDDLLKFVPSAETHDYYETYAAYKLAGEQYAAKKAEYDTAVARIAAIGDDTTGAQKTAKDELVAAETAMNNADDAVNNPLAGTPAGKQALYDKAYADYVTALRDAGQPAQNLTDADAQVASAKAAMDAAKADYDAANTTTVGGTDVLKINIKLSDKVTTSNDGTSNDKWQLLPSTVDNNKAVFYYTGILGSGETSSKLIDSVELDSSVTQDMYIDFDFDLNVALDSAQVTFDDDQKTIKTDAVTAEFAKTPRLVTPTDEATALVWS